MHARTLPTPFALDVRTLRTHAVAIVLTATALRSQLYRVLDDVATTGQPVEIIRKGKRLRIQVVDSPRATFSFDALERGELRPLTAGDPDTLPFTDFTDTWEPDPS